MAPKKLTKKQKESPAKRRKLRSSNTTVIKAAGSKKIRKSTVPLKVRKSERLLSARKAAERIPKDITVTVKCTKERNGFNLISRGTQYDMVPFHQYKNIVFLVCDTNICMSHLNLKKSTAATVNGLPIVAYIPYRTLIELDGLNHSKDNVKQKKASTAIHWLFEHLNIMPRLRGQSQAEMKIWMKHGLKNQSIRTEDDDVMEAAIGLGKEGVASRVLLLTDDKNLINKCRVNVIKAETSKSFVKKVNL